MKKIVMSLLLVFVLLISSCSSNEKAIEMNDIIPVGEYKMHQGDVKKIKGCRYYYGADNPVLLHFVDAKGSNLDYLLFQDSFDYEESYISISCTKKIEEECNITELIYKDDYSNNNYIYKTNILITNEESYSSLEPAFVNIDLSLSQGELFMINSNSVKVGFGRHTISTSKMGETCILKNIRLDSNLATIDSICYTSDRTYFLHDEDDKSLMVFNDEIDFSDDDYIIVVTFDNNTETLVYFDLIFDIEYCGNQFSIRRNMYIF